MNYDATKLYGKMVGKLAHHILSCKDTYKTVASLPYDKVQYLAISARCFTELYRGIIIDKEITSMVIDKYIFTENVSKAFPMPGMVDKNMEMDFIDRELGNIFSLLRGISVDVQTLAIIAHPEEYNRDFVNTAIEHVIVPHLIRAIVNFEVKSKFLEKQPDKRYKVSDHIKLIEVINFLIETDVIDEETDITELTLSILSANMSIIKPKRKEKFKIALARMKYLINNNSEQWLSEVCKSIGTTPKRAIANISNCEKWVEELDKIIAKNNKK